jgi:hypothetical protein
VAEWRLPLLPGSVFAIAIVFEVGQNPIVRWCAFDASLTTVFQADIFYLRYLKKIVPEFLCLSRKNKTGAYSRNVGCNRSQ